MIIVVAAIIRRNGKILITQRPPGVHLSGLWEFPGGKVEPTESLESALQREIGEELGIEIQVQNEFFRTDHHYPSRSVRLHFFNCSIIKGEPRALTVADVRWVAPCDIDRLDFPEADKELLAHLRG
jgi:mutator protein MutT